MILPRVTAVRFDRQLGSGRTKPCLLVCSTEDGEEVELVAKFAAGCDRGYVALAAEALAAMLASDLDLPVPPAYLVDINSDFAATIPIADVRQLAERSPGPNFGSQKLGPGYFALPKNKPLSKAQIDNAAEIMAFDTFIANYDRTVANPNLLCSGSDFAIIDHELAFFTTGVIGWRPPWEPGAISFQKGLPEANRHVFLECIRGVEFSLDRLSGAFEAISDLRIEEYRTSLPSQWRPESENVVGMIEHIRALRDNISLAISAFKGALL